MPILRSRLQTKAKSLAKPKVTNKPTQKPTAPPVYTPGQLTPGAIGQLAARKVRYTQQTGRDEFGNPVGLPGFIEQRRLGVIGDIGAQRVASERDRELGLESTDNNYAARGLGRSGLRAQARGRVETAALERAAALQRQEDQANLDARMANADEDYNFSTDTLGIKNTAEADAYQRWREQNPNQGAGQTAAKPAVPTWQAWQSSHPWAKTPAQKKLLKSNYDAMVARMRQ